MNAQLPLEAIPIGHPDSSMSAESVRRATEDFKVRPSDVIVATFPKTGTTLVSWLCHQIRTGGDVEFENIYEIVPWPTLCWDMGYDPNVDGSQFEPRVFKSHLRLASIWRGCKYVVTIRDPAKTSLSFFNFMLAKGNPLAQGKTASEFITDTPFVKGREGRASIWEFYQEYYACRDCPSVLVLIYEDVVQDMPQSIRLLAKFMGIEDSDELVAKVAEMGTKEFMAAHMDKFEEPYERIKKLGRIADLTHCAPAAKVVTSKHKQTIGPQGEAFLKAEWEKTLGLEGFADYASFASFFRQRNKAMFGI